MRPSTRTIESRLLITHINPRSPVSESYRTLRTNIQFTSVDKEVRCIMVTSAVPGEGKSTTAANLAVAYAQTDKQVLLVDADLRKPTVHHTFRVSNRFGLTSLLTRHSGLHDVIRESDVPNLYLLPSGPVPPNPSEMLSTQRMLDLVVELLANFDYVVIDTPPVLAVADAQIVSVFSDGVLLVIDSGALKSGPALKAKAALEQVRARILGVVLNNIKRGKHDEEYYYYYYE